MNWNDLLFYDQSTGLLRWKPAPTGLFKSLTRWRIWIRARSGKLAGSANHHGYHNIRFLGKTYRTHRIIWEMHNGPIPDDMVIDHINGNPSDNRLTNLRLATASQNAQNRKTRKDSRTRVKGVTMLRGKYVAHIFKDGKGMHIGSYETIEAATKARIDAEVVIQGEYAYDRVRT